MVSNTELLYLCDDLLTVEPRTYDIEYYILLLGEPVLNTIDGYLK